MILGQQEANKVLPLVTNLEAYEAFGVLLTALHTEAYERLKLDIPYPTKDYFIGQLTLIDNLKQLKERLKDSLRDGR